MDSDIRFDELKNRFHFGFLNYDPELEKEANLKLLQLLAFAPPGATGVGLVEETERDFLSTVTIRSPFRTFTAKAVESAEKSAVRKSLERLENELFRWRSGGGTGNHGWHYQYPTGNLPWARCG